MDTIFTKKFFKKTAPFAGLLLLSVLFHFYLWNYPGEAVFDEVYFGKFVSYYSTGEYYFDIHPPLGKLIVASYSKITDTTPVFEAQNIGDNVPDFILSRMRLLPTLCGSVLPLIFALFVFLLFKSRGASFMAGLLLFFDSAFFTQSRFILIDVFLAFFYLVTLSLFLLAIRQKTFSLKWFLCVITCAISLGGAISIKWTGLSIFGLLSLGLLLFTISNSFTRFLKPPPGLTTIESRKKRFTGSVVFFLIIIIIGAATYCLPFCAHFKMLTYHGTGDAFMSEKFQKTLIAKEEADTAKPTETMSFFDKTIELNKEMYRANLSLGDTTHFYSSKWYEWMLGQKPIYYWSKNQPAENQISKIYLTPNFSLWIAGLIFLVFSLYALVRKKNDGKPAIIFLTLGYLANIIPFFPIERPLFVYHYFIASLFLTTLSAFWLNKIYKKNSIIFFLILGIIITNFIILMPFSYGWSVSENFSLWLENLIFFKG